MSVSSDALLEVLTLLGGPLTRSEGAQDDLLRTRLCTGTQDPLIDSVLATLGFSNSAVQPSLSNISVRTLINTLSALISGGGHQLQLHPPSSSTLLSSCFAENLEPQHQEVLGVRCVAPLSFTAVLRIMKESLSFLKGTEVESLLVLELLEMLVKVFSIGSTFKSRLAGSCLLYEREGQAGETPRVSIPTSILIEPLIHFCLEKREVIYNRLSSTIRLLLWRLQPYLLAGDLSAILQVMAKRPLLSLRNELRHRQEWRNLVIAMASGPDTFLEGRQILSTWLLASGASCIWELKGELCAIIRDVLEHPSSWDLSEEAGISLPPLSAFYHNRLHSPFIILNQPPSWAGLLKLVSFIEKKSSQDASGPKNADHLDKDLATNYRELALQDSLWMLLMDFPAWLLFASLSLFQRQNNFYEGHINNEVSLSSDGLEYLNSLNHQKIAASYIAWHFSPQDQKLRDLALRMLMQMAQSWLCIKEEKSPGREDTEDVPATKRRKLMDEREMDRDKPKMDEREMDRDKPKAVDGRIAGMERVEVRTGGMEALGQTYSSKFATAAVRKWLTKFQDCCCLLDSYSQDGPPHNAETGNKKQAKRRLVMGTGFGDCALGTEQGSQQPETTSSECKSSSFFNTFPLVALLCAPHLHNETVAHLVLHFIMTESQPSSSNVHGGEVSSSDNDAVTYQAAIKGLACREPSHRTEDFRDICRASYCSSFSSYTSASPALGAARVFKFLETLDLLENSDFVNGCRGLGWLDGFKDIIARQLAMCISTWSQKVDSTCLTMLDDLRCRAALWAGRAGLNSRTMRAFNQVLQSLDVLIASSVVEDMLEDV